MSDSIKLGSVALDCPDAGACTPIRPANPFCLCVEDPPGQA